MGGRSSKICERGWETVHDPRAGWAIVQDLRGGWEIVQDLCGLRLRLRLRAVAVGTLGRAKGRCVLLPLRRRVPVRLWRGLRSVVWGPCPALRPGLRAPTAARRRS